jgi:hypothetical protein
MERTFEIAFLDPRVEVYAFTIRQLDMVDDLVNVLTTSKCRSAELRQPTPAVTTGQSLDPSFRCRKP